MLLLSSILVCAAGLGSIVYRYDMYEREPWYMLVFTLSLGAGGFGLLSYGEDFVLDLLQGEEQTLAAQAAVAAFGEELLKLLIVLFVWYAIPHHFNDPFDGLIYGAMAGLGFAVAESVFYVNLMGSRLSWLSSMGQEAVRLLLHLLMGALTCVGVGLARFRVARWPFMLYGCIAVSTLIHFSWDYFCGLPSQEEAGAMQQRTISITLMLTALVLFGTSVVIAVKHSGDTHALNPLSDLWGWPFSRIAGRRKGG
jgi:RsiW-degrading membrane proteinase PrsW (M82 family)